MDLWTGALSNELCFLSAIQSEALSHLSFDSRDGLRRTIAAVESSGGGELVYCKGGDLMTVSHSYRKEVVLARKSIEPSSSFLPMYIIQRQTGDGSLERCTCILPSPAFLSLLFSCA